MGTQGPLILCAPARNLHIILQNSHKFFALSEMWSSHSPDCFCVSFRGAHSLLCLFISHAAVYTFLLTVLPTFLSSSPLLQIFSSQIRALTWLHQNGLNALTTLSKALILLHAKQGSPQHLGSTIFPDPGTDTACGSLLEALVRSEARKVYSCWLGLTNVLGLITHTACIVLSLKLS